MLSAPQPFVDLARAKVNLALHVVGRRADGYHLLDMLVAFPALGDRLSLAPADGFSLAVTGPNAGALAGLPASDNLVLRAADRLAAALGRDGLETPGAAFTLEKHLPVMGGIGGGSANAAAALRLLARHWNIASDDPRVVATAASLGADVPMCLVSRPLRAEGVGEILTPVTLPDAGILLINPGVGIATPAVFGALKNRANAPLPAFAAGTFEALVDYLHATRNDLEAPATRLVPAISDVLHLLRTLPGTAFARMSGSGSTCFALFADEAEAANAETVVRTKQPSWWTASVSLS